MAAADLSFESPGDLRLSFERFYDSGFLGNRQLGLGWQATRYDLQFQFPSWLDERDLMRTATGTPVGAFDAIADTRLRSGQIRLVDHASGQLLEFNSSLELGYSLDNQGNPFIALGGLTADNVPTFSPGRFRDGSVLTQDIGNRRYFVTRPDGSSLHFDHNGNLHRESDRHGYAITYTYSGARLTQIGDSKGQVLTIAYGADGRIHTVAGPDNAATPQRRVEYHYDAEGRLISADTQAYQVGGAYATARAVRYQYNADNQIAAIISPDGTTPLHNTPDLRGRSMDRMDAFGNMTQFHYENLDPTIGGRMTEVVDMGSIGMNSPTVHGIDALRYFPDGATTTRQLDAAERVTTTTDALGNSVHLGYESDSVLPTSVQLPSPGRPAVEIERNAVHLPTLIHDPANIGGAPVQVEYNTANLPTKVIDALGRMTVYTYTLTWDLRTVTRLAGIPCPPADPTAACEATTTFNYHATTKFLESVVDSLGHESVRYTYDNVGHIRTVRDATGVTTTYEYDSLGRLAKVFDPRFTDSVHNFIAYHYNDNDRIELVTVPTGLTTTPIASIDYVYDPTTYRLTSVTDLNGNTTQFAYDPVTGALTQATQVASAGDAVTRQFYDRRGLLSVVEAPEGHRTAFRYDVLGRTIAQIEDDNAAPTATTNVNGTSQTIAAIEVAASEPILVASAVVWPDGQDRATGFSQTIRLADRTSFAFAFAELVPCASYRYDLTLTDRVGRTQTVPEQVFRMSTGNLNGDNATGVNDLAILQAHFGLAGSATLSNGDLNCDAVVNRTDVALFAQVFGLPATAASPTAPAAAITGHHGLRTLNSGLRVEINDPKLTATRIPTTTFQRSTLDTASSPRGAIRASRRPRLIARAIDDAVVDWHR